MESLIIVGCKSCLVDVLIDNSVKINGEVVPGFPVDTAYSYESIDQLFLHNYMCPFCNETLTFTPDMMEFVSNFIQAKYHISFSKSFIQITNNQENITFPKEMNGKDVEVISDIIQRKSNNGEFPTVTEMKDLLRIAQSIDSSNWTFKLQSKYVKSSIPNL